MNKALVLVLLPPCWEVTRDEAKPWLFSSFILALSSFGRAARRGAVPRKRENTIAGAVALWTAA